MPRTIKTIISLFILSFTIIWLKRLHLSLLKFQISLKKLAIYLKKCIHRMYASGEADKKTYALRIFCKKTNKMRKSDLSDFDVYSNQHHIKFMQIAVEIGQQSSTLENLATRRITFTGSNENNWLHYDLF